MLPKKSFFTSFLVSLLVEVEVVAGVADNVGSFLTGTTYVLLFVGCGGGGGGGAPSRFYISVRRIQEFWLGLLNIDLGIFV